jgi:predicted methyltransferase
MRNLKKIAIAWAAIASLLALNLARPAVADEDASTVAQLTAILNGPQRSAEHKARDRYRHPVQTLTFFGIKPDMTVVEIWPGAQGWYTEILAPFLREHGKLYEAISPRDKEKFRAKLAADPAVYGKVIVTELAPPAETEIAPPGSADMVLTFRNVHDWLRAGPQAAEPYFEAFYRALKPGGILGVVDHAARPNLPYDPRAMSGYVRPSEMISLAQKAGFKLVAQSDINANPKDDTNHPAGVWTLPPTLRLGAKDRSKYLAIGESNRMTLKFMKPR